MDKNHALVTVTTFADPNEAYLYKGLLDTQGIDSFIYDEHSALLTPVFMVRVMVKVSDLEKAKTLLVKDI